MYNAMALADLALVAEDRTPRASVITLRVAHGIRLILTVVVGIKLAGA